MKQSLENICKDFINNRDTIKETFKWENEYIVPICAATLCGKNVSADKAKLKECRDIVDNSTSIFSNFRGNVKLPVMVLLSTDSDPEGRLKKTMEIYDILKDHFYSSEYLSLVSAILADMINTDEADKYAQRGKTLYNRMKKEHPFLTSAEDSVFAVLMAFSEKTDDMLVEDMEKCYLTLKKTFHDGNSVQSLSHILALAEGDSDVKCRRVLELYDKITASGKKYSKYYEISVLGSMAMLTEDYDSVVEDMNAADDFLSQQKGYTGIFGIDKKTRLMHALLLVSCDYSVNGNTSTAAMTGTLAMVAAQQAAMCAVIAATAASTAANSAN